MLSLGLLHQSLRAHQSQLLPAWGSKTPKNCPVKSAVWTHKGSLPAARKPLMVHKLGGMESQKVTRVDWTGLTWPMKIKIWPCLERIQHRDSGSHINQSLLLCLWNLPSQCSSARVHCEWEWEILCVSPLKGHLIFQLPFISQEWMEFWLIFTGRCYESCSSWHWCSKLGSWDWGWGFSLFLENIFSQSISPNFWLPHVSTEPVCFKSLSLLSVLRWLLYIFCYKTSVQLSFTGPPNWLFYILVIILMWPWEEASTEFSYFTF